MTPNYHTKPRLKPLPRFEMVTLTLDSRVVDILTQAAGERQWPFDRLMAHIIGEWLGTRIATKP